MSRATRILVAAVLTASSGPGGAGECRPAALPGAEPFRAELAGRIAAALAEAGTAGEVRTRHREEDGRPRFTNRLVLEASPYLRQHAHNPVDWFPWGDEAFETAARLGRPVLLSVGYATCHWCHVMEEESFEDLEIARFLNEHYVAIKVDREERPDVDSTYMTAVELVAGSGGWPMTVWLTPDRRPYFAGTYFPPRDGERGQRQGFLSLLRAHHERFVSDPQAIRRSAERMARQIGARLSPEPGDPLEPGLDAVDRAVELYRTYFDPENGGVRGAPKFPSSLPVRLLLAHHRRTRSPASLDMARRTLARMAAGGLHDHVGGGFHRYAVDARWRIPHFEKMLGDNALLALAYLEGYRETGLDEFARVARRTLGFLARELRSPEGGFHSAFDADSAAATGEREEGRFYTWTPDELRAALELEERALVAEVFGVDDAGEVGGRNVLYLTRDLDGLAEARRTSVAHLRAGIDSALERMERARRARPAPLRDDKLVAAWNGLAVSAFARAGFVLEEPEWTRRAEEAARFVLGRLYRDGRLRRTERTGPGGAPAFLEDHAFVVAGLLDLYEATFDVRWLEHARELQAIQDRHYADKSVGGYFATSDDHATPLVREKRALDGAEPSGNSVALMNLERLHAWTADDAYRARADGVVRAFGALLARQPTRVPEMLRALEFRLGFPREIVIVTPRARGDAEPFLERLRRGPAPPHVLVVAVEGEDLARQARTIPALSGKVAQRGQPTAYVCRRGACRLPTTDPAELERQLASGAPAGAAPSRPAQGTRDDLGQPTERDTPSARRP